MNAVLVEHNTAARAMLGELLRGLGVRVVWSFADPEIALHFVLGRLREVKAVVLNADDPGAAALLRRLEVLPPAVKPIAYSGRKLAGEPERSRGRIAERLAGAVASVEAAGPGRGRRRTPAR